MMNVRIAVMSLMTGLVAVPLLAEPPVITVLLKDGTVISGFVGSRPGDPRLVVRIEGSRFFLERTVPWDAVEKLYVGGRPAGIEEVRQSMQSAADEHPGPEWLPADTSRQPVRAGASARSTSADEWITDVLFHVSLAAHGTEPDPDRLLLEITPVNAIGEPVFTHATVTVTLFAPVSHSFVAVPRASGTVWEQVGSWTVPLTPSSRQGERFVVHLPLRSLRIERRQLAGAFGSLHVRVVIPSQRVLERRIEWVPLMHSIPFQHQRP